MWKAGNGGDEGRPHPLRCPPLLKAVKIQVQVRVTAEGSTPPLGSFCTSRSSSTVLRLILPLIDVTLTNLQKYSVMVMEWIHGILYLYLWNHYNRRNIFRFANISFTSFWESRTYTSFSYQSHRGYEAIPIGLKWGILAVFHIFLEQRGIVITQLSTETTQEPRVQLFKAEAGSHSRDKKDEPSPRRDGALIV